MFAVVEFETDEQDGGELCLVNKKWFTPRKREVFWPPYKDQTQYIRALKRSEDINTETWKIFPVSRIFYEDDNYDKAYAKLRKAEFTSDIQTDNDDHNIIQRRRSRPRRIYESSDDEVEIFHSRPPPIKKQLLATVSQELSSPNVTDKPANEKQQTIAPSSCGTPSSSVSGSFDKIAYESLFSQISYIKEQNKQILDLLKRQSSSAVIPTVLVQNLPTDFPVKLPIQTNDEVDILEEYLRDQDHLNLLSSHFSSYGGKEITGATNRILKHVLSDYVASAYSFFGKRLKKAFCDLALKTVVIRSIKARFTESTDREIEDVIKVWLKHAPQRLKSVTK